MSSWMKALSDHYEEIRERYPQDRLIILFDIDGTILDARHMILHTLRSYEERHGTAYFPGLTLGKINFHENMIGKWLERNCLPQDVQTGIINWCEEHYWSTEAIMASHHPFTGVMEVIRWFQIQPNTAVGLNTGRPEALRRDTLRSLNRLGEEYRVEFFSEQLHMSPYGWGEKIISAKIEGIGFFQRRGFRVFAFVDNEPENLKAVAEVDDTGEILLLHADTVFASKREKLPANSFSGKAYDIAELAQEKSLPMHVQFVWHGVNDEANLRQFTASSVQWAECEARMDMSGGKVILRHDSFEEIPAMRSERFFYLDDVLTAVAMAGKKIKIDLKENGRLIDQVLDLLAIHPPNDGQVWFNGKVEILREEGYRRLADSYPEAIIQCPIDFLVPLIIGVPQKALGILDMLQDWGLNRFSIKWKTPRLRQIMDKMDRWGLEVNIYNVPDLEEFLRAVLLLPRSITSDFNFPAWRYFGCGAGEKLQYDRFSGHQYQHEASY